MKLKELRPVDVEHFPEVLEEGVLYISEPNELAAHRCCCGCGEEVMTPLNAARWRLFRSQGRVSLVPSIGNWKFPCRSHYWIRSNRVVPSYDLSDEDAAEVFERDRYDQERYFAKRGPESGAPVGQGERTTLPRWRSWLRRILGRWKP